MADNRAEKSGINAEVQAKVSAYTLGDINIELEVIVARVARQEILVTLRAVSG